MKTLISWEEYKNISPFYDNEEDLNEAPSWFNKYQDIAITSIINNMYPNEHIFPNSIEELGLLKDKYKDVVKEAIAYQIDYVKDGYIGHITNPTEDLVSGTVNRLSRGPLSSQELETYLNKLCHTSYIKLLNIGWIYRGLNRPLNKEVFYNEE